IFDPGKCLHTAYACHKFHCAVLPVEVKVLQAFLVGTVDDMGLYVSDYVVECRLATHCDCCWQSGPLGVDKPTGIYAIGRDPALRIRGKICCGKAQFATASMPMDNLAFNRMVAT